MALLNRRSAKTISWLTIGLMLLTGAGFAAEDDKTDIMNAIDAKQAAYGKIAHQIWEFAEPGYQEKQSSALLQETLSQAGFTVTAGVADIPTAFVATYGQGKPVIGILAEFDALPGLSQDHVPKRQPIQEGGYGHACGHHLFGTASTAAAIAVRDWLASSKRSGTIRLYGTPAEEGGSGKVYMARAGLFDDVDTVLHWHPGDQNVAGPSSTNANKSAKFRFYGTASHAASAPHRGRSALDGVEAMDYMVNLMREHIPEASRIHYVITHGGDAPNIVPEFAEVFYYVRHPEVQTVKQIWERVVDAAEGAAKGTGTRMEYEVIHGNYSILPNDILAKLADVNLRRVGGLIYTAEEQKFAEEIYKTFEAADLELGSQENIQPFEFDARRSSSDVGDISWLVPTVGFRTATYVPGTAGHSWQVVAAGGTSIGTKGMMIAAKTLALVAHDLFVNPATIEEALLELKKNRGKDFQYSPLLGDRDPPLDYRR